MSLTQIVKNEKVIPLEGEPTGVAGKAPMIYSPKLDRYVPLNSGNPKGEIQKYNVGMGPGNWY